MTTLTHVVAYEADTDTSVVVAGSVGSLDVPAAAFIHLASASHAETGHTGQLSPQLYLVASSLASRYLIYSASSIL